MKKNKKEKIKKVIIAVIIIIGALGVWITNEVIPYCQYMKNPINRAVHEVYVKNKEKSDIVYRPIGQDKLSQFMLPSVKHFEFQKREYCCMDRIIEEQYVNISSRIECYATKVQGGQKEQETIYVYEIIDVSVECMVAVRMKDNNNYYLYQVKEYIPSGLKQYLEELGFRENLEFLFFMYFPYRTKDATVYLTVPPDRKEVIFKELFGKELRLKSGEALRGEQLSGFGIVGKLQNLNMAVYIDFREDGSMKISIDGEFYNVFECSSDRVENIIREYGF